MSTLKLLKDCKRGKAGQTVTVPFLEARDLVKAGVAERHGTVATPTETKSASPPPERAALEVANKRIKELESENTTLKEEVAAFERENKELTDKLAAATKPQPPKP